MAPFSNSSVNHQFVQKLLIFLYFTTISQFVLQSVFCFLVSLYQELLLQFTVRASFKIALIVRFGCLQSQGLHCSPPSHCRQKSRCFRSNAINFGCSQRLRTSLSSHSHDVTIHSILAHEQKAHSFFALSILGLTGRFIGFESGLSIALVVLACFKEGLFGYCCGGLLRGISLLIGLVLGTVSRAVIAWPLVQG